MLTTDSVSLYRHLRTIRAKALRAQESASLLEAVQRPGYRKEVAELRGRAGGLWCAFHHLTEVLRENGESEATLASLDR